METAWRWSKRSQCRRPGGQCGAVLTNGAMDEIWSFGYNGPARGLEDYCRNTEGSCGCIHAETNAIIRAGRTAGGVLFCTTGPCEMCAQMIVNARIFKVFYDIPYRNSIGIGVLVKCGVECQVFHSVVS